MRFAFVLGIAGFALTSGAVADTADTDLAAQCAKSAVQGMCAASCRKACDSDAAFLSGNVEFCLATDAPTADDANCATVFGHDAAVKGDESEADGAEGKLRDCSEITDLREKLDCKNEQRENSFPVCARNADELKVSSKLLIREIETELAKYQGVLTANLDDVSNLENLCKFSFGQLSNYYKLATEDSGGIGQLQSRAVGINSCAEQIKNWVEKFKLNTTNSEIQDALIRKTDEDLKSLKPFREKLGLSVRQLKEAGPKLETIGELHLRFCPSEPPAGDAKEG